MSGFSPEWLTMREPADRAARNVEVLAACQAHFAGRTSLSVCDLGAGTGASLRALANALPAHQVWTLIDHAPENLRAARAALSLWAARATERGDGLVLERDGRTIDVSFRVHDLARRPRCWPPVTDLVTASALLDLTSEAWIERLAADVAASRAALLAMLTFDGHVACDPVHPLDAAIRRDFAIHQHRDKGFGPAAGPDAAAICVRSLKARGLGVTVGDSPWLIDDRSDFRVAVVDGIARAVSEIGAVADTDNWRLHARAEARRVVIGHADVFAVL
jgi:hypothetical protein